MTDTLSCSQCKKTLSRSAFAEDQQHDDDDARICLMCKIKSRDEKAKQIVEVSQSELKASEEDATTAEDTQQSQQPEQETEQPPQPQVFFPTHMYAHPEVHKWIPCVVECNMQNGRRIITMNLGSNIRKEIVINKYEVDNRFEDYDESYAFQQFTEEHSEDTQNHNHNHNQNQSPSQPITTTTATVAIGSDFPSTEDVDMSEDQSGSQSNSNSNSHLRNSPTVTK